MPSPEECKEVEHEVNEDSSFTKEVFQEAFGELYTEHVKITLKNSDHLSAFPCDQDQRIPSVSTFKKTYFGATKSQSMNENLTLKDEEPKLEIEGRTHPIPKQCIKCKQTNRNKGQTLSEKS